MVKRARAIGIGAGVAVALAAGLAAPGAAEAPRRWSEDLKGARVAVALERQGGGEALVVTVTPHPDARIEPPVVRIDAPTLVRRNLRVTFPTTVRAEGKGRSGAVRASLPLEAPGGVRLGDPDSNDGALRVEYRACTDGPNSCTVERADIPLRAGP